MNHIFIDVTMTSRGNKPQIVDSPARPPAWPPARPSAGLSVIPPLAASLTPPPPPPPPPGYVNLRERMLFWLCGSGGCDKFFLGLVRWVDVEVV
jgi:hypothetical protein